MDSLSVAVFVVAFLFGLLQHVLENKSAPISFGTSRWWTNGALFVADTASVTVFAGSLGWLTHINADTVFALKPIGTLSVPIQVLMLLIVHGFIQYWVHRAGHQSPHLWKLHRVHHSDTRLDATTALRHHPFESILDYLAFLLATLLLAPSASGVLCYFIINIGFAMFTHFPPNWLPARIDRALSFFIITPRLHQLHHSNWQAETDTNYGTILVVWDQLFGTFLAAPTSPRPNFALGLNEFPENKAQDPFIQLASPFTQQK